MKIKTNIKILFKNCEKEIKGNSSGIYGSAMTLEGYAGGYKDALEDVLRILDNLEPNSRYWK
jgi:hypothetical protein